MKKHTLQFKNKIKEFGRQLDSKITYELNGETIELGNEKLNSITPTFQSKILKSAMKQLDIDSNKDIPLNTEINYKFGTLIDNEYEYIDYGNYIVYSSEKQEDTDSYKIVCYDKMLYSMVNYEGLRNGSFPMTIKEFLQNICKDLYIDFKDSEFANQDRIIEIDLYKDLGYTYRDVLDEISEVTASTICMNDNDELEVRYIDYASNDTEVTGETITITDNELDKANSLIINGNLEQNETPTPDNPQEIDVVEGVRNLLNEENKVINCGFDNTNNIIVSSTAFDIYYIKVKSGNTYISSINLGESSGNIAYAYSNEMPKLNTPVTGRTTISVNILNNGTFTVPNNMNYLLIRINKETQYPYYNNWQIEEGNTSHSYVPYGSNYLINKIIGKNLFDKDNVNASNTIFINQAVNEANVAPNNYTIIYECKPNTTYFIKNFNISSRFRSCSYPTIITGKTSISNGVNSDNQNSITIKTGINDKYLFINTGNAIYNETIAIYENIDYNEYLPYEEKIINYDLSKKNLFDKDNYNSVNNVFINQAATQIGIDDNNLSIIYECKPNTTYFVEVDKAPSRFRLGGSNELVTSASKNITNGVNADNKTNAIIHTTSTDKYIYINIDSNYDVSKLKIYEGTESYYYLAKIGDNIDTLDEISGVLNRKIVKLVLNGSETFGISLVKDNIYRFSLTFDRYPNNINLSNNIIAYSNYFNGISFNNRNNYDNSIFCYTNGTSHILSINTSKFSTLSSFKQWLLQNPVTVYYILKDSETIQLTPTQIPLNKGTNNLSLESNMPTEMTLKYTNEIDTIDEEYLKDVNVNFGEKYGPVNSIVLSRAAESDNVYLQDEESIEKNGLHELKIIDNQIMNFNDRSDYLPELLERLDGLEYYLNDFSSTGICYYDICDKYRIKVFDNIYECVMFNDEVNITQGLEENVYTELPEETETDYTKADKTDQRINQTYIIVDKQNKKIESLASQVIDLTREKNGIRYLEINDAYPSDIITLKIKGKFSLLFPSESLFPDDDLFMTDSNLIIGTKLPRGELYPSNDLVPSNSLHIHYDGILIHLPVSKLEEDETLIIDNNDCYIEKDDGTINHYGEVHIPLNENDDYIYLQDFSNSPIDYYGKYAIKSEYTTVFTTKLEMSSSMEQTASEINLEVRKKVDTGDVVSTINQSAEQITLKSNRLVVESDNFKLDGEGNMECSNAKINGDINLNSKNEIKIFNEKGELVTEYNYNGATFYRDDNKIGTIGTSIMNSGAKKGLSFLLDGDYMSWAFKNNQGTYDTKLRYDSSNNQLILTNRLGSTGDAIVNYGGGGNAVVAFDCTESGLFYTDGNRVSHMIPVSSSDYRLKENIKNTKITALDLINKIKHKEFNWKKSGNKQNIGYIAQELEEILEDYVNKVPQKDENNNIIDYLYEVNMLPLLATATKAIQEQQDIIEYMQNQIDELKEMINNG